VAWAFWAYAESARGEQNLTLTEVCRRADIRRQTYMELRRTTRRPQSYIVLRIAKALNLDADHCLALAGLAPTDSATVRLAIINAYDLNAAQKDTLLGLIDRYSCGTPRPSRAASSTRVPAPLFVSPAAAEHQLIA
jgi:transcriptional regulator with XRE-family HTH domain